MRYGWLTYWFGVVLIAVVVAYALYRYGEDYNNSFAGPTNSVGGPLTVMICVFLGVAFDVVFLFVASLGAFLLLLRQRRRSLDESELTSALP